MVNFKKRSIVVTAVLTAALSLPVSGAAVAADVRPMGKTGCVQTVTPTHVAVNFGGKYLVTCYNGTTYSTIYNVAYISSGAYPTVATVSNVGNVTIPANSTRYFNSVTVTKLVVG